VSTVVTEGLFLPSTVGLLPVRYQVAETTDARFRPPISARLARE
jgi:hypothetical protein